MSRTILRLGASLSTAAALVALSATAAYAPHVAQLQVSPAQVSPGQEVTVFGPRGYGTTNPVELRWGSVDGPVLGSFQPNAELYAMWGPGRVKIPDDATSGVYVMYATQVLTPNETHIRAIPSRAEVQVLGPAGTPALKTAPVAEPTATPAVGLVERDSVSAGTVALLASASPCSWPVSRPSPPAAAAAGRRLRPRGHEAHRRRPGRPGRPRTAHQPGRRRHQPQYTSVVNATYQDLAPTRTYSSPYVLIDPEDPNNVVASTVEMRTRTCKLLRSTDSGQTWRILDASPDPALYPFCFNTGGMQTETPLAWGRDHTLYDGLNGWDTDDGGRNTRGKADAEVENDTPVSSVAVDTRGPQYVVYGAWRRALPNSPTPGVRPPIVAVSADGGQSFGEPVDVNAQLKRALKDANGQDQPLVMAFNAPQLATDDKGTLYVAYPVNTPAGITPAPAQPIFIGRSTDQGQTFEFNDVSPPSVYNEHVLVMKWSAAGGPQGTLHVIYEDKPDQPAKSADRDI